MGFIFAFNAGVINAVTLLATSGTGYPPFTSSHHTGTATRLGIHIARGEFEGWNWFALCVFFALGASLPGFFIRTERFHPNRKYGILMIVEAIFLFGTTELIRQFLENRDGLLACRGSPLSPDQECYRWRQQATALASMGSFACGIQNALCTNLTGAVVRTTHVSGLLTDIGMLFGQTLRFFLAPRKKNQIRPELWRWLVWGPIFTGFVLGCSAGTAGYDCRENTGCTPSLQQYVIDISGGFVGAIGLYWTATRLHRRLTH